MGKDHGDERLFAAGINYRTASVAVRERLSVAHPDRMEVSRRAKEEAGLSEAVLLWTCNRVEVYGVGSEGREKIRQLFRCLAAEPFPLPLDRQIYHYDGEEAARHLFRVAGGLDSMVLGETQITGQVKEAYEAARQANLTGKVLNQLFQKALQTAKEIRTRTSVGRGSGSVGSVAVTHAERALGSGSGARNVLVIGAGTMATSCIRHLVKWGGCSVVVANRSLDRAEELAREFKGRAIPFDQVGEALVDADVVVSSTGSPAWVVRREDVQAVLPRRGGRPLVMIDIAVPRDIDPAVGHLPGVHLHDIDALEATVQATMSHRREEVALCDAIIQCKVEELSGRVPAARRRTGQPDTPNRAMGIATDRERRRPWPECSRLSA
jgi:glutamyl-tRNA reductase